MQYMYHLNAKMNFTDYFWLGILLHKLQNDKTELLRKVIRIQESYLHIISFLSYIIRFSHRLSI